MEITLSKYSNFILGWKEALFKLSNDEMSYTYTSNPLKSTNINYNSICYSIFSIDNENEEISLIIPKKNKEFIYLHFNKNEDYEKLNLFGNYLNFLKYAFRINEESFNFLKHEKFKLNTKELFLTMNLYVSNKYFCEIYANTKSNKLLANSVVDAIEKRTIVANIQELYHSKDNKDLYLVEDLKKDLNNIFLNEENDKKLAEFMKDKDKKQKNPYNLENIDKVREYYLALIRILIEVRRTVSERMITTSLKENVIEQDKENNESLSLNKMDIYSRLLFVKGEDLTYAELLKKNNSLTKKMKEIKKENKDKKSLLKTYVEKTNYQLNFCYKCGNILFLTELVAPTCKFDLKCTPNSYFFCKVCKIHYCTYCSYYPKNLQCTQNHQLTATISSIEPSICSLCNNTIPVDQTSYECGKCNDINELILCSFCYDEYSKNNPPINKCSCGKELCWKRGVITKCNKCLKISTCFWFCFFCKIYFCSKCYSTNKNYCGLMHKMEEINLNLVEDSKLLNRISSMNNNSLNYKEIFSKKGSIYQSQEKGKYVNNQLNDIIHGFQMLNKSNCDVCKRNFCFKYYICYRCLYIKCLNCMNNTVTFKNHVAKKVYI